MIPQRYSELDSLYTETDEPGCDWLLDFENGRIGGPVSGEAAVRQSVRLRLQTEAQRYPVYSSDYGLPYADILGQSFPYAYIQAKNRICDTLLQDTRITGVSDFVFTEQKDGMTASFTVNTVYGQQKGSVQFDYR